MFRDTLSVMPDYGPEDVLPDPDQDLHDQQADDYDAEMYGWPADVIYVAEGWWHPNVKSGQIHDHPENPNGSWSIASHRLCEPVYTKRQTTKEPPA